MKQKLLSPIYMIATPLKHSVWHDDKWKMELLCSPLKYPAICQCLMHGHENVNIGKKNISTAFFQRSQIQKFCTYLKLHTFIILCNKSISYNCFNISWRNFKLNALAYDNYYIIKSCILSHLKKYIFTRCRFHPEICRTRKRISAENITHLCI